MPYLDMNQFQKFFKCATEKILPPGDDVKIDAKKYIDVRDKEVMKYPESIYNFVMGKHPPGQPISWLRFALFICKEGGRFAEQDYLALPGETGYSDTITDEYKERMKKLVEIVKKQQSKAENAGM